jgi:hypothetical protein
MGHKKNIPTFERTLHKVVENVAGKIQPEIGLAYTYPVRLQHLQHVSVESFEIGRQIMIVRLFYHFGG